LVNSSAPPPGSRRAEDREREPHSMKVDSVIAPAATLDEKGSSPQVGSAVITAARRGPADHSRGGDETFGREDGRWDSDRRAR
jgi:hypothetical protein